MRVAFLGFGLIGGSIARALRARRPDWQLVAWTPTGAGPRTALDEGTITAAAPDAAGAVDGADVVLIAAPPLATLTLLDELGGALGRSLADGAVVTDVASTKAVICDRAATLGLRFVGGHPMAGSDATGYRAADGRLFVDRPWIVVAGADDDAARRVETIAEGVGARPVRLAAGEHDDAVAAISHLPLVVSAALVDAVARRRDGDELPRRLAAGGWRDMTRLARGDVEMGAGILATNPEAVARHLRALRTAIDEWLAMLEQEPADPDELRARLVAARRLLDRPVPE